MKLIETILALVEVVKNLKDVVESRLLLIAISE